jgi:alkylation response protein AidB-like acyl-CoA dehydrogenase
VLHFAVPLGAPGVTVLDNWRTMAMRASGSNDVVLDGVFVPEGAVSSRRQRGVWDPFLNVVTAVAVPLVMSVYLGVAEAARDLALEQVAARRDDPSLWYLVGEPEKALEVVGGGGLLRARGLERLVRDLHAAQFHPMQAKRQHRFSGRAALGLDPAA